MPSHLTAVRPLLFVTSGANRSERLAQGIFLGFIAALLPTMVLASFHFGVTWDEIDRHKNGQLIWEFLTGLRSRSSFAETGGHLYGGLFDVICVAVEKVLPGDRYVLRHIVNAIFGWIGVLYCGRLAARLFGTWSGVLAMALLAASPRYFADSMNNPKDLPFAAMTVVALYYMSHVSTRWPYISVSTGAKIAVALGLSLNIRAGGLLYVGYVVMLVAAFALAERCSEWRRLADTAARIAALTVAVLLLGTLFWPWAQGAPLTRPFRALIGISSYPWSGYILFAGRNYIAQDLPWFYVPWWFLISTPPVVLLGAALSAWFAASGEEWRRRLALWAIAIFPVAVAIVRRSTVYDGIRHFEFVYPILVVLAASGWTTLLRARHAVWLRRGAAATLAVGLASVLTFDVRFHPNQGVYFNSLVGGPRGAFARYDMDYWGNSILQAVQWARDLARSAGVAATISGNPEHIVMLDAGRYPELFSTRHMARPYFWVRLARGPVEGLMELEQQPALYQVRTPDGALLCSVIPGAAYDEFEELQSQSRAASKKAGRR